MARDTFQMPEYEVSREHGCRARVACRERCSREDVLQERKNWLATLGN